MKRQPCHWEENCRRIRIWRRDRLWSQLSWWFIRIRKMLRLWLVTSLLREAVPIHSWTRPQACPRAQSRPFGTLPTSSQFESTWRLGKPTITAWQEATATLRRRSCLNPETCRCPTWNKLINPQKPLSWESLTTRCTTWAIRTWNFVIRQGSTRWLLWTWFRVLVSKRGRRFRLQASLTKSIKEGGIEFSCD